MAGAPRHPSRRTVSLGRRSGPRRGWRNSDRRRRHAATAALLLLLMGLLCMAGGIAANSATRLVPIPVSPHGVTRAPHTWFFQNSWALYADIDDPRRPPSPEALGCVPVGFVLPRQPADMTAFGSRVVDGVSVAAVLIIGHSGPDGRLRCVGAESSAPLWLMSASAAPPFTPTAITLLGVLLIGVAALVYPGATEIPTRIRSRFQEP